MLRLGLFIADKPPFEQVTTKYDKQPHPLAVAAPGTCIELVNGFALKAQPGTAEGYEATAPSFGGAALSSGWNINGMLFLFMMRVHLIGLSFGDTGSDQAAKRIPAQQVR